MTRRDFELLAEVISRSTQFDGEMAKRTFVAILATKLQAEHPRFDTRRFILACRSKRMAARPRIKALRERNAG